MKKIFVTLLSTVLVLVSTSSMMAQSDSSVVKNNKTEKELPSGIELSASIMAPVYSSYDFNKGFIGNISLGYRFKNQMGLKFNFYTGENGSLNQPNFKPALYMETISWDIRTINKYGFSLSPTIELGLAHGNIMGEKNQFRAMCGVGLALNYRVCDWCYFSLDNKFQALSNSNQRWFSTGLTIGLIF